MNQFEKFARPHTSLSSASREINESSLVSRHPSGFFFLTPVWGESYTKLYVDTVIPAQLANGNLGAFKGQPGHRYIVYTRPEDAEFIRSSKIFEQLNSCVPVTFEFLTEKVSVVHDMMTDCYRRGIRAAEAVDAAVFFLTPDIVLSNNAFTTIKQLSDAGSDVIYIPAIRTMKKAVAASLEKTFRQGNAIEVAPRQLMRVALDNLHPLADASWWEEGEGGLIPANIYWRIDDEGIVGRCFHLHPIFVFPQRKNAKFFGTVDDDYVPAACPDSSRDCVVEDSDQLLAIELSDPGRFFVTRFAKGSVGDTVRWAEQFTNVRHRQLFQATIRMHTGIVQPGKWAAAEERAGLIAQDIEARLALPSWRLLSDADLLVRRLMQAGKEFRVTFANRGGAGTSTDSEIPRWKSAVLSSVDSFVSLRAGVINLMRRLAAYIEGLSAKTYQARVRGDLIDLLPLGSDPVLVANNPEKTYLAPLLSELSRTYSPDRYASLLRQQSAVILEKGDQVPDSSKGVVILEIDSYRTKDVDAYLHECRRVLQDNGRLIVSLHRLGFAGLSDSPPISSDEIVGRLNRGFKVVSIKRQGGLGSYVRVKFAAWLRSLINRHLAARWLLLVFGVPLLPVIALVGGLFVLVTAALDFLDRSGRYSVSTLVLAEKI